MWVYISVVVMEACPSMAWMSAKSAPPSSKCVAKLCLQGVGTDFFLDSGIGGRAADDGKDHRPGEPRSPAGKKYGVGPARGDFLMRADGIYITLYQADGPGVYRDETLLRAFSPHADKTFGKKQVGEVQLGEFRHPQSAGVHQFEHRTVAFALGLVQPDRCDEPIHFLYREYVGQTAACPGRFEQQRRIFLRVVLHVQKTVKPPHGRYQTRKGTGRKPLSGTLPYEILQVFESEFPRGVLRAMLLDVKPEFFQIEGIRLGRAGTQPALDAQVMRKIPDALFPVVHGTNRLWNG